jgi:hypothetical protein
MRSFNQNYTTRAVGKKVYILTNLNVSDLGYKDLKIYMKLEI